jgi:hypothetical protein
VGFGRGAVAARWAALLTCRGAGWGTRMLSHVLTAVRSDRDRWFGERVSPWWRAVAVQPPGAGVAEEKGGPATPVVGELAGPDDRRGRLQGLQHRECLGCEAIGWPPEAVMLRSASAALGSLAVRTPRTGTT